MTTTTTSPGTIHRSMNTTLEEGVRSFRAGRRLFIPGLGDVVAVAGPNCKGFVKVAAGGVEKTLPRRTNVWVF